MTLTQANDSKMTDDELLLTVAEAAEWAGTTERTIRRWIAADLPTRKHNGLTCIDLADLNRKEAATRRKGGKPRKWTSLS